MPVNSPCWFLMRKGTFRKCCLTNIPSRSLTARPLKNDAWKLKTFRLSFWGRGIFSGASCSTSRSPRMSPGPHQGHDVVLAPCLRTVRRVWNNWRVDLSLYEPMNCFIYTINKWPIMFQKIWFSWNQQVKLEFKTNIWRGGLEARHHLLKHAPGQNSQNLVRMQHCSQVGGFNPSGKC